MLIVHYFNVLSLEHKLHNSKKTRKMNRLAILPLAIMASCLYSCSPKLGESVSGNSNDATNYNSYTATNNVNTAVQAGTSTSATVNNPKEINSKDLQPTQGKIVDFQEK